METWYGYEINGEKRCVYREGVTVWTFFRRVAEEIAMSHISGVHVTDIVYQGDRFFLAKECCTGLRFEFVSRTNPLVVCINWAEYLKSIM